MKGARVGASRQLERLFGVGTVGGLSDAELIGRFADAKADHEAAQAAFEAIVARHGPMILRVCRSVLNDAHAAEDAFQATFLVLARHANTLGDGELLGNWLYGVALRTSRKARIAASRRVDRDRVAASRRSEAIIEREVDERGYELSRILHEEIGRLPSSYRVVIVTCYVEGLTQAQAASRLRLAESTVRGRLARARTLLSHRLSRRGVAPAVGLLASEYVAAPCAEAGRLMSATSSLTTVRLPGAIVQSLARDALHYTRSAGPATHGAVPQTVRILADGVLSNMWFPSLKGIALAASLATVGFGLAHAALGRPMAEVAPVAVRSAAPNPVPPLGSNQPSDLPQESGERRQRPPRRTQKSGSIMGVDQDLATRTTGTIVRVVPVSKDCTIISYLPNQNLGQVDNLGVENYGGGIRAMFDWPAIPAEESTADRKFLISLYSRKTSSHPPSGQIHAFEIVDEWPELNAWSIQPRYDPEPAGTYKFEPGEGWKLFDITPLVRAQSKAGRKGHGVLLRFLSEDFKAPNGSGYEIVSREGAGEWASRRPMLLVVKDAKAEKAQAK